MRCERRCNIILLLGCCQVMSERCGVWFLRCARKLVTELQSCFFLSSTHKHTRPMVGGTIICLVWCVCTWTDLWRMVALKTDRVMEAKLEAWGFIPGWFMRCVSHMMVSAESVATCLGNFKWLIISETNWIVFISWQYFIRSYCTTGFARIWWYDAYHDAGATI